VRPLDIVRKVVLAGAALRKRRAESGPVVSLEAGLRVVALTTDLTRRARAGPLPPARGLERIALSAARAQLRLTAGMLGLDVSLSTEPPSASHEPAAEGAPPAATGDAPGFVSPGQRALVREEREAQIHAALGALVGEALALVDAVLLVDPELASGRSTARLSPRTDAAEEDEREEPAERRGG